MEVWGDPNSGLGFAGGEVGLLGRGLGKGEAK